MRNGYFTFAFLRRPIARTLSAYQEVSFRLEPPAEPPRALTFLEMPEGLARFGRFLEEVGEAPWDGHVHAQSDFLREAPVDFLGAVERLERDMGAVLARLGLPPLEGPMPRHRSRADRAARGGYARHAIEEGDLPPALRERIREVYAADDALYRRRPRPSDPADDRLTDAELRAEVERLRGLLDARPPG